MPAYRMTVMAYFVEKVVKKQIRQGTDQGMSSDMSKERNINGANDITLCLEHHRVIFIINILPD